MTMSIVCLADMPSLELDNYKGMIAKFKLYLYSRKDICEPGADVFLRADIWVIDHFINFKAVFRFHSLIPVNLKEGRFSVKELNNAPNADTTIQQMRSVLQQVGNSQGEYLLRASAEAT